MSGLIRPTAVSATVWGVTPVIARALLHLADGGGVTDDVAELLDAAREVLDAEAVMPAPSPDGLSWQYRRLLTEDGEIQVREVYFSPTGDVEGWTSVPAALWGQDEQDLLRSTQLMLRAFELPVLVESELPGFIPTDPS